MQELAISYLGRASSAGKAGEKAYAMCSVNRQVVSVARAKWTDGEQARRGEEEQNRNKEYGGKQGLSGK